MSRNHFLFELGTEELPPTALKTLSNAFTDSMTQGLATLGLGHGEIQAFASPRRLAILVRDLESHQADQKISRRGPSVKAPEKAVEGFAKSCGVTRADLQTEETPKGDYFCYQAVKAGQAANTLLPTLIDQSLASLPIPKRMRWGSSRTEFVRPVQWVVALLGDDVLESSYFGVKAGRATRGHRFHADHTIEISHPSAYQETLLNEGRVVSSFEDRRQSIKEQVLAEAARIGGQVEFDEELLDEVCALNEWPVALTGRFEERFLEVPEQALILSMKENQKYFHLVDAEGALMPFFITVANIESKDPARVIAGNERVIRPRLADAAFFFETDKKQPLAARLEKLKTVVFQNQLGTLYEKTDRVSNLAREIAEQIGGDPALAYRAGQLSKCDLLTDTVYEFTELQGLMGYHFARHDGEDTEVACAIEEHYLPRFSGDKLPNTQSGIAVALADRLDTLIGLFAINQPPTGSKDPFALRRAALGVLRIIVEHQLTLDLRQLLTSAAAQYSDLPALSSAADQVFEFMLERFRFWFEEEGISAEVYLSVAELKPTSPLDFSNRARAVAQFDSQPVSKSLVAANKRVSNLLNKAESASEFQFDAALLSDAAEKALSEQLHSITGKVEGAVAEKRYEDALNALASLKEAVDRFFDEVRIMSDDPKVQANRLALLANLRSQFMSIADISKLA